ncbi:MAG: RluA family pseudouridine synthase [candidate division SR1 bacterium]|nr:RluA family pseudouridine synthase [candidate division SR1 bacterium]
MNELIYKDTGSLPAGRQERIDTWLVKQFPYTRSFFHHIITRAGILVNEKPVKKSYQLKNDDKVKVDDLQRYLGSEILEETPKIDIPIILEKDDYLVINKPKGVLSHPKNLRELSEPSVVGFLYHRYKELPSVGNFIRAGLLHRLDKETDGLMIIAKTEKGLAHFKNLFDEKTLAEEHADKEKVQLKKFYRATSHLTLEGEKFLDDIKEFPFTISEPVIAKVPFTMAKLGITKILHIKKSDQTVALELEILTGRTHQIRYHLSHHGLPIIGDYLYGKDEGVSMQLTAYKLMFQDPDGEMQTIEILK